MPDTVRVELADRPYDVTVGPGSLDQLPTLLNRDFTGRPAFVVFDSGLPETTRAAANASLAAQTTVHTHTITPTERDKSLETLAGILRAMTVAELGRGDPVIAIGGGIVGDVAGFAAATYRRAVPVIQGPTTLLSMVDASVGGKTGVNLDAGDHLHKNMVGAFHQPRAVIADVAMLDSLDDRHLRSGLAECVKHGMLSAGWGDADLGAWIDQHADALLVRDHTTLTELVRRNVAVKASVVVADEREEATDRGGGRAQLNLGHTFGHAFETIPGVSPAGHTVSDLQHGEAVAIGLVAAAETAARLGRCDASLPDQTRQRLERVGLPTRLDGLPDSPTVLRRMGSDKKVIAGSLRLVLPSGDGTCSIESDPPEQVVLDAIDTLRA